MLTQLCVRVDNYSDHKAYLPVRTDGLHTFVHNAYLSAISYSFEYKGSILSAISTLCRGPGILTRQSCNITLTKNATLIHY